MTFKQLFMMIAFVLHLISISCALVGALVGWSSSMMNWISRSFVFSDIKCGPTILKNFVSYWIPGEIDAESAFGRGDWNHVQFLLVLHGLQPQKDEFGQNVQNIDQQFNEVKCQFHDLQLFYVQQQFAYICASRSL